MRMKSNIVGILILGTFFCGCRLLNVDKNVSDTNAMTDKSWFRTQQGVDRFYLAYPEYGGALLGGPEKNGWEITVGLACYNESKTADAKVKNPADGSMIALNKREKLSQFKVIGPNEDPSPGDCRVILGDPYTRSSWDIKIEKGMVMKANIALMGTASSCLGMAAAIATVAAATTATVAAAPVTVGASVAGFAAVSIPLWVGLGTAAAGCAAGAGNMALIAPEVKANSSYKALLKGFAQAEIIAMESLKKTEFMPGMSAYEQLQQLRYQSRSEPSKLVKAVALFNPRFVRAFNYVVVEPFEQGWGGASDFYSAVQAIRADIGAPVVPVTK